MTVLESAGWGLAVDSLRVLEGRRPRSRGMDVGVSYASYRSLLAPKDGDEIGERVADSFWGDTGGDVAFSFEPCCINASRT